MVTLRPVVAAVIAIAAPAVVAVAAIGVQHDADAAVTAAMATGDPMSTAPAAVAAAAMTAAPAAVTTATMAAAPATAVTTATVTANGTVAATATMAPAAMTAAMLRHCRRRDHRRQRGRPNHHQTFHAVSPVAPVDERGHASACAESPLNRY